VNFEWDPEKATENLKKHGVGFEEATTVSVIKRGSAPLVQRTQQ
jgi:uncharacterized DUF497 family protein